MVSGMRDRRVKETIGLMYVGQESGLIVSFARCAVYFVQLLSFVNVEPAVTMCVFLCDRNVVRYRVCRLLGK